MNVNDVVCVGAEPIVLVDYLAVELGDEDVLREIAVGLKAGAEPAGVEIPGGVGGRAARAGPRAPLAARLRPDRGLPRQGDAWPPRHGRRAVPGRR